MKKITVLGAYLDEQLTSLTSIYLTYHADPEEILDELESTLPLHFKLLAASPGTQAEFDTTLQALAASHSKGSWFHPTKDVLDYVNSKPVPQVEKKSVTIVLDPEDFKTLRRAAKRLAISRTEALRKALRLWATAVELSAKGFRVQASNGSKTILLV